MTDAEISAEYRKNHFALKIEKVTPEPFAESELVIKVTTNGMKWQSLNLTEIEAECLLGCLGSFLSTPNRPAAESKLPT